MGLTKKKKATTKKEQGLALRKASLMLENKKY